jgi:hypothetical protein
MTTDTSALQTGSASENSTLGRASLTVEHLLYGAILILALGVRIALLGRIEPLSPLEAAQAWPAFLHAMGLSVDGVTAAHSPLLYTVQRTLFWLTDGGSDAKARLIPALVSGVGVLLAWGFRPILGRVGGLALALLLAFGPYQLAFSRLGDGAMLSVVGVLLLLLGVARWAELGERQRRWLAVVAGLTLVSGPLFWLLLPVLGMALALWRPALPSREQGMALAGIAGVTALAVASGWLAYWEGLTTLSASLSIAVSSLTGQDLSLANERYPLAWPFVRFVVDQPLLWSAGSAGLLLLWRSGQRDESLRPWAWLILAWTLYGGLLMLLPGRGPLTLLLASQPFVLATAFALDRLLRFCAQGLKDPDSVLVLVALGVLLVTGFFVMGGILNEPVLNMAGFAFLLLVPVLVAFFCFWSTWRVTAQMTLLLTLASLSLATLSSSWMMNLSEDLVRADALKQVIATESLRHLSEDVTTLSAIRVGDGRVAPVVIAVGPERLPLVGWYLRTMRTVQIGSPQDPSSLSEQTLFVTDVDATFTLPDDRVGSRYRVSASWLPLEMPTARAWLRWAIYREMSSLPEAEFVVLWARR